MQQYEKDFQSIINSNDINERYIKISNISERMESKNKLELFNNIIYYSENYKNVLDENNFIDYLGNITPGAFIPCSYIPSLKLIKEDIITERDKDSNIIFNIITNKSSCNSLFDYLNSNLDFKNCINKVCIFCSDLKQLTGLKDKYDFVFGIYNNEADIKKFIEKFSSLKIKPFPMHSVITYDKYINKY